MHEPNDLYNDPLYKQISTKVVSEFQLYFHNVEKITFNQYLTKLYGFQLIKNNISDFYEPPHIQVIDENKYLIFKLKF